MSARLVFLPLPAEGVARAGAPSVAVGTPGVCATSVHFAAIVVDLV